MLTYIDLRVSLKNYSGLKITKLDCYRGPDILIKNILPQKTRLCPRVWVFVTAGNMSRRSGLLGNLTASVDSPLRLPTFFL